MTTEPLQPLELVCLGPPTARLGGAPAPGEVLWRKNLALLVYLALSPDSARSRSHLTGVLWPDKDEGHARHSLNEAVRRLRHCLGAERLDPTGDRIRLSQNHLDVDALALERGPTSAPLASGLRGDFLEGFVVEGAPAFEEWAESQRVRYRAIQVSLLIAEGERQLTRGESSAAFDLAVRALALDAYAEPAVRLAMRAAALVGDAGGALRVFRGFADRLTEIHERPAGALTALAERIRRETWRAPAAAPASLRPRFVGQQEGRERAARVVAEAAAGACRVLLITGEPGSGRSRFLRETVEEQALEGALVVAAAALPADRSVPWSTLRALLRAGLADAPGMAGARPDALSVLAALSPELAARAVPREPRDHGEVAGAIASLLGAISDEHPLVLAVDDIDRADGATIEALFAGASQLSNHPVLIAGTASADEHEWPLELLQASVLPAWRTGATTVRLAPLGAPEMADLVAELAPWCAGERERAGLARRLSAETVGSPLLAVALLQDLAELAGLRDALVWPAENETLDASLPVGVPQLIRHAILTRVAQLDSATQRILAAASIGDVQLDLDLVAALAGVSPAEVEQSLPAMERQRLIAFDRQGYAFATPLVARVVRGEMLTPGQAASLRRRAIDALVDGDLAHRVLRVELLARAAPGQPACDEAVAVAEAALAAADRRLAHRALRAAERAISNAPNANRAALEAARSRLAGTPSSQAVTSGSV